MVCTVTPATSALIAMGGSFAIIAVVTLIVFLATRELATTHQGSRLRLLGRYLLIPIIPLVFAFALIGITTIIEVPY